MSFFPSKEDISREGYRNTWLRVLRRKLVCFRPACVKLDFQWPTVILIKGTR